MCHFLPFCTAGECPANLDFASFLRFQDMPHQFWALNFFLVIHDRGGNFPDFASACLIFSWTSIYIACFWCHVFFWGGMVDISRKFQQALDFGCLAGRGSDKSSRETGGVGPSSGSTLCKL